MPCRNIHHFKTEQVLPKAIDSESHSEIKIVSFSAQETNAG